MNHTNVYCGRFAPSATGPAHPGTLLAALLCWLDARSQGGRIVLRLENLDPQRCTAQKTQQLIAQLRWFGLDDWDVVEIQSQHTQRHKLALAELISQGMVYACRCSRSEIKAWAQPAVNGGWVYPGTCHQRLVNDISLAEPPLRVRLNQSLSLSDLNGGDLSQDIPRDLGDPVILRRDGAVSYLLAAVVDDAALGVTHVVRGQDLAATTAVQVALSDALGHQRPRYRHHFLLTEAHGYKLAKFHGSVGVPQLRECYQPEELCGILAHLAGLRPDAAPCQPDELLADFSWDKVTREDRNLGWDGTALRW